MLKWFRKQKSEPETIPAQIHPAPKLPAQRSAIAESIFEEPTPVPREEPVAPPAPKEPAAPSPISPIRSITTPPEKAAPSTAPAVGDEEDEPMILPLEELEAAEKAQPPKAPAPEPPEKEVGKPPREEDEPKSGLRPVQALMPKAGELKSSPKLLYRQLLAGMYDAIIITDPKGHVIETNSRVRDLFLANADSLWDAPISKLVHGITPQLLARLQTNIDKDRHVLLDATCKRADGTTFGAEVAISGVTLMNDGDFVFMIRNVDKRRQTMTKLRMYQNALEMSPCPTAIAARDGKVIYGNPSLASFLGLVPAEMAGYELKKSILDEAVATQFSEAVARNGKWEGSTILQTGKDKTSEAYISVLPDTPVKGKPAGSLVYIQPM